LQFTFKAPSDSKLPSSSNGFKLDQEAARQQAKSANAGKVAPIENMGAKSGNESVNFPV
jgi:hypothetical protein